MSTDVISNFRFVDRNMFVRYLGGGIGHKATNKFTSCLRLEFSPEGLSSDECHNNTMPGKYPSDSDEASDDKHGLDDEDLALVDGSDGSDEESDTEEDGDEVFSDEEEEDYEGEDGEEPWDVNDIDALGYSAF